MAFLKPVIENSESELVKINLWKVSLIWRIKSSLQNALYLFSKGKYKVPFRKWREYYDICDAKELARTKIIYYKDMDNFYKSDHRSIYYIYENYGNERL